MGVVKWGSFLYVLMWNLKFGKCFKFYFNLYKLHATLTTCVGLIFRTTMDWHAYINDDFWSNVLNFQ